ncbi:hypothetical protein GCM10028799_58010 [Kribbella italica]
MYRAASARPLRFWGSGTVPAAARPTTPAITANATTEPAGKASSAAAQPITPNAIATPVHVIRYIDSHPRGPIAVPGPCTADCDGLCSKRLGDGGRGSAARGGQIAATVEPRFGCVVPLRRFNV